MRGFAIFDFRFEGRGRDTNGFLKFVKISVNSCHVGTELIEEKKRIRATVRQGGGDGESR
jgi:hypothetical protein